MPQRNLAVELLQKLRQVEIKARSRAERRAGALVRRLAGPGAGQAGEGQVDRAGAGGAAHRAVGGGMTRIMHSSHQRLVPSKLTMVGHTREACPASSTRG
jgi:hypothetical protein